MRAPLLALALLRTVACAAPVSLPFTDAFDDALAGPWVAQGGAWTHNGTHLAYVQGVGVDSCTVQTPDLGGTNDASFTVSQVIQVTSSGSSNQGFGFGLLSAASDLSAPGNSYYLVDLVPRGYLRIAQIDLNSTGGVTIGDVPLTQAAFTFSTNERYAVSVNLTYGRTSLTLRALLNSDGNDTNILVSAVDPTPLRGQHQGIETFVSTHATARFDDFTIGLRTGLPAEPPPVTDETPGPGKRVRVTAPEYAGTLVHHTLYLPTNWSAAALHPVIVEFAPNAYQAFAGTVEDTQLGYYQSEGRDFIWLSFPCIDYRAVPYRNATSWWGGGTSVDPTGQQLAVQYALTNLVRALEAYRGDPAAVFLTGFSRGAIAAGYLGLATDEIADCWLAFLPHSHHDGGSYTPDPGNVRLSRVRGRASFITYGQFDSGSANSIQGMNTLASMGFPVEAHELRSIPHTDEWITPALSPIDSSYGNPAPVPDVGARLREWLQTVRRDKPGTHRIRGRVVDAAGVPLRGARLQSGLSHWTLTDEDGGYDLAGLVGGERTLTCIYPPYCSLSPTSTLVELGAEDVTNRNFIAPVALFDGGVLSIAPHTNGLTLTMAGATGWVYTLQRADQTEGSWSNLATLYVSAEGSTDLVDSNPAPPAAVYRAACP